MSSRKRRGDRVEWSILPTSDTKLVLVMLLGAFSGVAVYHIFKTQFNKIWSEVPYIKNIRANN